MVAKSGVASGLSTVAAKNQDLRSHQLSIRGAIHLAIERIALHRISPGLADDALDVFDVKLLVHALALALGDVVPDDRAVQVIHAPIERKLREVDRLHDP